MFNGLKWMILLLGVLALAFGVWGVVVPGRELNVLNPQAATMAGVFSLFVGVATLGSLYAIERYRPRVSYLLLLLAFSTVLFIIAALTAIQGGTF